MDATERAGGRTKMSAMALSLIIFGVGGLYVFFTGAYLLKDEYTDSKEEMRRRKK